MEREFRARGADSGPSQLRQSTGESCGSEWPAALEDRAAIEVEQLQRLVAHREIELLAVPLRVAADLERHVAIEPDVDAVAEKVGDALARSETAPDARSLGEHLGQAHRGEAQLELARCA